VVPEVVWKGILRVNLAVMLGAIHRTTCRSIRKVIRAATAGLAPSSIPAAARAVTLTATPDETC